MWHECLGHPSRQVLSLLAKNLDVGNSCSDKVDEYCNLLLIKLDF